MKDGINVETSNKKFNIKNNLDIVVAFAVIGIILMIIIPLPKVMLDVLLALNLCFPRCYLLQHFLD